MAASDDFKRQLKAGKIAEALALAMSEAIQLKITTWVSSSESDIEAKPASRLRTRMNLIDNELENEIGTQFLGNAPYRELRQFHQEQVLESHKIIQDNLRSLQALFEFWVKLQYQNLDAAAANPSLYDVASPIGSIDKGTSGVEPFVISPGMELEAIAQTQNLYPETTYLPGGIRPPSLEALHLGTEENWDSSLLENPQSFPAAPLPTLDALNLGTAEDWGNFEQSPSELLPSAPSSEGSDVAAPPESDDAGLAQLASITATSPADEMQPLPSDPAALESGWETVDEAEIPSLPATPPPSLLDTAEDWGDIADEAPPAAIAANTEESILEEVWDNWEVEAAEPPLGELPSHSQELKEDWDEFVPDELEPYPPHQDPYTSMTGLDSSLTSNDADLIEMWEDEEADPSLLEEFERLSPPPSEEIMSGSAMSDDTLAEWLEDVPSNQEAAVSQPVVNEEEDDLARWLEGNDEDPFKTVNQPDEPRLPNASQTQSKPE